MYALLAAAFLTSLTAATATGQTVTPTTGAVYGTVTDSSEAVVPGVTRHARWSDTDHQTNGAHRRGRRLSFSRRAARRVWLTFELTGFATIVRQGIRVGVGFTATVDAELRPGNVIDSVSVSGAPVIDLTSTEVTARFDSSKLATLPGARDSLCGPGQYARHRDDQGRRRRQRRAQHAGVHRLRPASDNRYEPQRGRRHPGWRSHRAQRQLLSPISDPSPRSPSTPSVTPPRCRSRERWRSTSASPAAMCITAVRTPTFRATRGRRRTSTAARSREASPADQVSTCGR